MAKANKTVAKDLIERVAILERKLQKVGRIQVGGNPFQGTVVNVIDLPDAPDIDTDIYYVSETNSFYYWNTVTETWEVIGGGGGGGGHTIRDEGVTLPARTALDFVGPGVTAFDHAAGNRTVVNVPGLSAASLIRAALLVEDGTAIIQYDNDSLIDTGTPESMTLNHGGAYIAGVYVLEESVAAGPVALRLLLDGVVIAEAAQGASASERIALTAPGGFIAGIGQVISWEVDGLDPDRVRFWLYGHPDATSVTALGHAMSGDRLGFGAIYARLWGDNLTEAESDARYAGGTWDDTSLGSQNTRRLAEGAGDDTEAILWLHDELVFPGYPDLSGSVLRQYTEFSLQAGAEALPGGGVEGPIPGGATMTVERGYWALDDLGRRWEFGWTEEYNADPDEAPFFGAGHKTYTGFISLDGSVLATGPTYFSDGGASEPIRFTYDPYGITYGAPTIHLLHSDLTRLELPDDSWMEIVGRSFKLGMFNRGDYPWYLQEENGFVRVGDRRIAFDSDPTLQTWIDTYAVLELGAQADAAADTIDLSIGTDQAGLLQLVRTGAEGGNAQRYVALPTRTGGFDWTVTWDDVNTDRGADVSLPGTQIGAWIRNKTNGGMVIMGSWWDGSQDPDEELRLFINVLTGEQVATSGYFVAPIFSPSQLEAAPGTLELPTGFIFDPLARNALNEPEPLLTVERAGGSLTADGDTLDAIKLIFPFNGAYEWGLFYLSDDPLNHARLERWQGDVRRFGPYPTYAWTGTVPVTADPIWSSAFRSDPFDTSAGAEPDHHGPPEMDPPGYNGLIKINTPGVYTVTVKAVFDAKGPADELPTAGIGGEMRPGIWSTYDANPTGPGVEWPEDPVAFSIAANGNEVEGVFEMALSAGDLVGFEITFDGDEGEWVFIAGMSLKVEPAP